MQDKLTKFSSLLLSILACATILTGATKDAFSQESAVTVQTDKDSYQTGDTITISGKLTATTINQPILIQVLDPQGNHDEIAQITARADGSYTHEFTAGALMNTDGKYTVIVSYKTAERQTTFDYAFTGEASGWQTIQAGIGGQNHPIQYIITGSGNSLDSVTGSVDSVTLLAKLSTQSDGTLSLRFDKETLDAKDQFFAFADDVPVDVFEAENTGSMHTIHIDFDLGTDEVEIGGDSIIPEFGSIAAILLAAAIAGVILPTMWYAKLNNVFRKNW